MEKNNPTDERDRPPTISVRLPAETRERLEQMAHEERRSLSNLISWIAEQYVRSQEQRKRGDKAKTAGA